MRKFRARQILQLVSVDCLGEGVDVPAIEVVSMARKTASWQLMCQQFGRALRVLVDEKYWKHWDLYSDDERKAIIAASTKPKAIIIDHVGNIIWHAKFRGLPDSPQEYTTARRPSGAGRGKGDAIPMRVCVGGVDSNNQPKEGCFHPYERFYSACPHCGAIPLPGGRSSPEAVDGDLVELDPAVLAALRGEVDRVNGPAEFYPNMSLAARTGYMRNHHDRYAAQKSLQRYMQVWGGWQHSRGLGYRESQKLFFLRFGIDVMTAQTLGATDAVALEVRIAADLDKHSVYEVTI